MIGGTLKLPDLVEGYVDVLDEVLRGDEAAPVTWRGRESRSAVTRELLATTLVIPGNAPMLPLGTNRKVSTTLAAVEAVQVCGGFSDFGALVEVAPALAAYADEGAFHGAYGPRLRPQLETLVHRLRRDPETRRAVVVLWDPLRDAVEGVHNYPCATMLQFMARGTPLALDLHVSMRANDAWHGLAYDAFVFNQLQWTIAREVLLPVGTYYHHVTSLHLYEEHWPAAGMLTYPDSDPEPQPNGFSSSGHARRVAADPARYPISASWYAERLL